MAETREAPLPTFDENPLKLPETLEVGEIKLELKPVPKRAEETEVVVKVVVVWVTVDELEVGTPR